MIISDLKANGYEDENAKHRRSYVLRRMREEGMISQAEREAADKAEISVYPVEDVFHEFAPYFVEQVRKDVVNRFTNNQLLNQPDQPLSRRMDDLLDHD